MFKKYKNNNIKLQNYAHSIIPGLSGLLGKRPELYLPGGAWPTYYSRAKGINIWDLKGKKYIDHSLELGLPEKYLDFSGVFQTGGPGLENNKSMWMTSFGFNDDSQLKALLPDNYRSAIEKTNNKVWDNLDNPEKLLTLFDDYNDGQAGKRIINYIQNEL